MQAPFCATLSLCLVDRPSSGYSPEGRLNVHRPVDARHSGSANAQALPVDPLVSRHSTRALLKPPPRRRRTKPFMRIAADRAAELYRQLEGLQAPSPAATTCP